MPLLAFVFVLLAERSRGGRNTPSPSAVKSFPTSDDRMIEVDSSASASGQVPN